MAKLPLDPIQNNEEGLSVRDKLNTVIQRTNETAGVEVNLENHVNDKSNPHEVKAPQVKLEPVLTPLPDSEQNVQDALEFLYQFFTDNGNNGWQLDHIDGNFTVIQIKRDRYTQFPPDPSVLYEGELFLNRDEGEVWTKLMDGTVVKIGDQKFITDAPDDGELYGRKDNQWHRISLATVSDDMPQNPQEGDLWVDTKNTMELYVFIGGSGWVSMTGAGGGSGGALPDNVVLDDIDGTLYDKLLGREIAEDGSAVWRPIYSSDVIPADGASPMTRADGSELRTQADINKFLYENSGGGLYVKKIGDKMTGPLEVDDVVTAKHIKSTKLDSGEDTNLSLQRKGDTKLLITSKDTLAYQPVKYNAEYTLDHDRHLINKGYVDELVEETVENADLAYVQKHKDGGDSMEGPLTISNQAGVDSRSSRRLNALNVFSGTSSSSLQLGTTNTKIYIGHNDTSFNTPLKVHEIQDRGAGITVTGTIKFADQDVLMDIAPAAGTTQHINLFEGVGSSDTPTTLKVDINGATFKKAIEFESGPSSGKEVIFRLDSNRGVRARNLNMDDTNITKLADPVNPDHAVNLKTVDGLIGGLEDRLTDRLDTLITDNSSGEMKFVVKQAPSNNGDFMCMTANGASTTYDPMQTREVWAHNKNLAGYDFKWDEVEPNTYFYMAGPDDSLARFRVVAAPIDQGTWTKIKVNDPEIYPSDKKWEVNDQWDILFRTFTGESVDLDDYVKKSGDTMTGQLEAQLVTDYIKFSGDSKRIVEDGAIRMTIDKRIIVEKGNAQPGAGFELKGRTSEGVNQKLLQVYHNNTGGTDAVNYYGKQEGNTNLATVGYVKSLVGGDSDASGDTPFTPYGPLKTVPAGRVPVAGEISFGSYTPAETTSIALSKTDQDGKVWDYRYNADSIFTVTIADDVGTSAFRQTVSVRVDGVEDKGNFIVLTIDGRDLSCKQRDEETGQFFYVSNPLAWYANDGAIATPLQKTPVTYDEMFQFRDETSIFPTYLRYKLSTDSGDGFTGASKGRLYMQGSLTDPTNIRLCTLDQFGYGYLGRAAKTSATAIVSIPGEMTIFARSLWSKQIMPVEGFYFDSLYFNHSKESMRLQNWGKSWDSFEHHTWKANEEVFVKFDFAPKAHTSARMEQEIAELTMRLAKLEGTA
jgi:hypothetical protein